VLDRDCVVDRLIVGVALIDRDTDIVREDVTLTVILLDVVVVPVIEEEGEADLVCFHEPDGDTLPLPLRELDTVDVCVVDCVDDLDPDALRDRLTVAVGDCDG
jgi:hypothetical protein